MSLHDREQSGTTQPPLHPKSGVFLGVPGKPLAPTPMAPTNTPPRVQDPIAAPLETMPPIDVDDGQSVNTGDPGASE